MLACWLLLGALPVAVFARDRRMTQTDLTPPRPQYRVELNLDYHAASFTGRETVRFANATRDEWENVTFHIYPNLGLTEEDDPWLVVQRVSCQGRELKFSTRARQAVLKVELPTRLAPGQNLEITLEFSARIPRVQREETSLLAHFLQEVNDAVSDERQQRDARDIFFAGEEAMMLGYCFPLLALRPLQPNDQPSAVGVNGIVFSEVADYEVALTVDENVTVIASGTRLENETTVATPNRRREVFRGEKLRGFALVLAERVKSSEQMVGSVRVMSYYREGDERLGKRALQIASLAVEAYTKAFGQCPYPQLQVIELPLSAGYSGTEFPSLVALAQAYYIDFDAPQAVRLPGMLREQSDVIKSSFEFTLAHGIAHQWWGGVVGSDPERTPYLDEALANYAAAYYHEAAYGKALGKIIVQQQLRGVYHAYRMLGGTDIEVDKPAKEFRSSLQYTAIVQSKGALLFVALRQELGDEKFFQALHDYFTTHSFRIATPEQLRTAFTAVAPDPRAVRVLFQRWLKEKHGDDDIGAPDLALLPQPVSKMRSLGRVFLKIGRTAAKPF
ncbi:MAG: hypothetical protein JNJ50_03720 [Acidobacteria bacterium]|nr:hypothetical protein [Acidobacteriota bacterium]